MGVREASMAYADLCVARADGVRAGYRQTAIGMIPMDWNVFRLGELATLYQPVTIAAKKLTEWGFPVYGANGVVGFFGDSNHSTWQVTVTCRGSTCGTVNRTVDRCWITGNAMVINCDHNETLSKEFFYHLLCNQDLTDCITGTGQPQIVRAPLASFTVPVPSTKAEQEAIAEALSDADALIESLQQLIAKKRQIKQGAMQTLLTGQQRLPGFSGEWLVRPLGDLFEFSGGFTASRDQLGTEGHCYLHYGDIHTSSKSFVDVRAEHQNIPKLDVSLKRVSPGSLLKEGDVVFVDASEDDEGASKHVVILNTDGQPFISGLHTIVAKAKTGELAHDYLRHCFHTAAIKSQFRFFAVGTKVSGISKTNIAKITMHVPSVAEQTAIATILSDMDTEIAALETRLSKTREIKQGMMQALLTGAIRLPLAETA